MWGPVETRSGAGRAAGPVRAIGLILLRGAARRGSGGDRRRADQAGPDRDERRPAGSPAALGGPCPDRPAVRLERRHRAGWPARAGRSRGPLGRENGTSQRRGDHARRRAAASMSWTRTGRRSAWSTTSTRPCTSSSTDYNLRSNRVQGTAGYALLPELWMGTQVGYQHYALGGSRLLERAVRHALRLADRERLGSHAAALSPRRDHLPEPALRGRPRRADRRGEPEPDVLLGHDATGRTIRLPPRLAGSDRGRRARAAATR